VIAAPKQIPVPTIKRLPVKDFSKGVVSAYDDGSTPVEGLKSAENVILVQDSKIRPRPSLIAYGPQPLGTVLGEIFPYKKVVGTTRENWLISMQNVASTTKVYIAKGEDTTWTVCNGKTYSNTARAHFLQVNNKVLVMNGSDNLSYLTISTGVITPYTVLTTPAVPTGIVSAGITGTTFNMYYSTTWNSTVGETDGSATLTKPVLKDRELWAAATDYVDVVRGAIPGGATSWNLYAGQGTDGSGQPQLYLIVSGIDIAVTTFRDDGTRPQQLNVPLPTYNSTAGPKSTRGEVINGRPWLTGDPDNPYYVWRGGDPGWELDFSPSNGGGYSIVGSGTENLPIKVKQFRDNKGTPTVTVLSQGLSGSGKRSLIVPQSITYGSQQFIVYQVTEDNGQEGTDSPDGVVVYKDSLLYPSREGFKTTGTKPQLQNLISTDKLTNTIQDAIQTLNVSAMDRCVGLVANGRAYWALPVGSTTNNQIWVLDMDRGGAWVKPWSIAADWMLLYTDNSGVTHHLVLSNNKLCELAYVALTTDNGVTFSTSVNSGQIKFSDDGMMWGRLIMVILTVYRPQGAIAVTVSGETKGSPLSQIGSENFVPTSSRAGWSEPGAGWSSLRGWSEIVAVPVSFNDATQYIKVKVNKDVRWWSYALSTVDPGVDYTLASVVGIYVDAGIQDIN